jgi:hypothetical protein
MRKMVAFALATGAAMSVLAGPAGAQQVVDAGEGHGAGGLAFVLFSASVMLTAAALFYMDRIRRRATTDDAEQ